MSSNALLSTPRCQGCRSVNTKDDIWICVQCRSRFCGECWDKQGPHNPQNGFLEDDFEPVGFGRHEKVSRDVFSRLAPIFARLSDESRTRAYEMEAGAKWFGICRGDGDQWYFGDTARLTNIIDESWTRDFPVQYPSIVSFIGQTGAGKSSIIQMLVTQQQQLAGRGDEELLHPVAGIPNGSDPTTGDVHLYVDPATQFTLSPLLFADCEGLGAGDKTPLALNRGPKGRRDQLRSFRSRARQKISWANGSKQQKRDEVVANLFPKILYTISDVVVFVLKEPRTLEAVVTRHLIPWAAKSIYKSLNQAVQPHIIIVINAVDISIDEAQWDHANSTRQHLDGLEIPFKDEDIFLSIANELPDGMTSNTSTVKSLLEHFYASVTIVNIPQKGHFMRMDSQIRELYGAIKRRCSEAQDTKSQARVLLKAERLERVLTAAFDHFAQDAETPFDFLSELLWQNPLPGTLGGNILQFVLVFQRSVTDQNIKHNARRLFDKLVPLIESCIMLHAETTGILGGYDILFRGHYRSHLRKAFEAFCETALHCAFQHKSERCCNVKSSHGQKGHQKANGKFLGKGSFELGFNAEAFLSQWEQKIEQDLKDLMPPPPSEKRKDSMEKIAETHRRKVSALLSKTNTADFVSYHVCLCCLRHNMPEYPTPCGKAICEECMETFREKDSDKSPSRKLVHCPFHLRKGGCLLELDEKPPNAGVRMLCLDGGGMRGIIQLAILRTIEKEFQGSGLKIQWFFDLVVGTSAGGIIALCLFVKGWPLEKCIRDFKSLCKKAFTPRELKSVPFLGKLAMMNHGSKYKTKPLESILQSEDILGNTEMLFEYKAHPRRLREAKVAITSVEETSKQQAVIFANYNRPQDATGTSDPASYGFVREERPCNEMKIWEVARATSAAFPYFKSFSKDETKREFSDGGLYHNCPVKIALNEKRLLWDDVRGEPPDIFLSLGTGQANSASTHVTHSQLKHPRFGKRSLLARTWNVAAGLLENIAFCANMWRDSINEATNRYEGALEYTERYIRLDVQIPGGVPKLDAVDKMDELEALTAESGIPKSKEVAHRLIASCFYLHVISATSGPSFNEPEKEICIRGAIKCRFPDKSGQVQCLGRFLGGCLANGCRPTFRLEKCHDLRRGDPQPQPGSLTPISDEAIRTMTEEDVFSLPPLEFAASESSLLRVSIRLQKERYSHGDCYLSISGFPRNLVGDAVLEEMRLNREFSPQPELGCEGGQGAQSPPPPPYSEAVQHREYIMPPGPEGPGAATVKAADAIAAEPQYSL